MYTDGFRLLVDVAVGDAIAPSYRKPPPPSDNKPADPMRMFPLFVGDRANAATAATMISTSRIPHYSLASPGNRSP